MGGASRGSHVYGFKDKRINVTPKVKAIDNIFTGWEAGGEPCSSSQCRCSRESYVYNQVEFQNTIKIKYFKTLWDP